MSVIGELGLHIEGWRRLQRRMQRQRTWSVCDNLGGNSVFFVFGFTDIFSNR
jgi:hypothetical protein